MNVNLDVLTEIFSHLTAVEALAFSTACRAVYSVVIPLVLRDVSVHLGTDIHRVNQFISFALKDGENRPNLIQHFQLNGTPYFQDGDGQTKLRTDQREDLDEVGLTEVLLQAQNIQNLHLDSPEFLLTRCPRVAVALQRCKFRHLTFSWAVGPVTIDALCSMHHSPRKLALLAPTLRTPEIISVTPGTIHTESWKFSAVSDTMVLSAKTVFPHARRLQWFESVVTLSVLAHSFPNIDKLEFRGSRLTSERRQDCWRRLDYFKGLLDDFKNVFEHASISVRHLDFDYVMPVRNYDAEDWDVCTAAVRIASPSVLFLPLSPIDNQVVPLRFRQASRSLKCLKVMLYFLLAEDVEQWIDNIKESFDGVPLVAFCICFVRRGRVETEEKISAMASRLANSLPSASFVGFHPEYHDDMQVWWQIVENEEGRHVKEIPRYLSKAIANIIFAADSQTDVKSQVGAFLASSGVQLVPVRNRYEMLV